MQHVPQALLLKMALKFGFKFTERFSFFERAEIRTMANKMKNKVEGGKKKRAPPRLLFFFALVPISPRSNSEKPH